MSLDLTGKEEYFNYVREIVCDEIEKNQSYYEPYISTDFYLHVQSMRKNKGGSEIWATEAEILAVSSVFDCNIKVLIENKSDINNWQIFRPTNNSIKNTNYEISVQYVNGNHFNLIQYNKDTGLEKNEHMSKKDNSITHRTEVQGNENKREKNPVFNLSSKELTEAHRNLLGLGLKFVPTNQKIDMTELIADVKEWERRMRLREFFFDQNEKEDVLTDDQKQYNFIKKKKSNWTPPTGRSEWLDLYLKLVKNDIIFGVKQKYRINLNRAEEEALQALLSDQSIVIRPCDKSSGVCVINTEDYVHKIENELQDSSTYKQVEKDLTEEITKKVEKTVNKLRKKNYITDDIKRYMLPRNVSQGSVKGNPKMHNENAPLRLIISGINHPTENIAEFAEKELEQHVRTLPSYIQDTTDFINKLNSIEQQLPGDSILFCMDVKGLYPSVPKKEGLDACKQTLDNRPNPSIPTTDVLSMIRLVLENNNFSFNGKHYLQVEETAIGSRLGMNYASTYLGVWEQQLLEQSPDKPHTYFRYVDDIWGIWLHGEKFHDLANSIHPRIKIELKFSKNQIEFLDTITVLDNGFLKTKLYEKPTDKHMYLHKRSDHPKTVKKSIPYGLGVRVKRICDDKEEYEKERSKIKERLTQRGYNSNLIEKQLLKVDELDRKETLKYRKKHKNKKMDRVPLILTYSRALPDIGKILSSHQKIIKKSPQLRKIFKDQPLCSFRRDKNLADIMVHQKTAKVLKKNPLPESRLQGKCERKCVICEKSFRGELKTRSGRVIKINKKINCRTSNVVYAVHCKKCKHIVYVGETETMLKDRIQNHLSDIRTFKKYDKPVSIHFNPYMSKEPICRLFKPPLECQRPIYRLCVKRHSSMTSQYT